MLNKFFVRSFLSFFLVVSLSLMNANIVLADDPTPPPATAEPTEEPAQPTEEPTPTPDETPLSEEQVPAGEEASHPGPLTQVPENTEIIVLDENGETLPLVSNEALNIILDTDPMWCPAGVLPGGAGCTTNFGSIAQLINNMMSNTNAYDHAGVIYFTANPGASFTLTTSSLGTSDYNQLKDNNLTLQGGWNGQNGANATFTGQTNFGSNSVTIGTSGNPWVGNITLINLSFSGVSNASAVTVYTTSGDITVSNVDVAQQAGDNYTANLDSVSGDIVVQDGSSFDGNNSGSNQNRGFRAETNTGSITIDGTSASPITFNEANGCGTFFGFCILPTVVNYNGASLSAPTVTLNYVSASNNDLNGIQITNATSVTLNHVNAINNGTNMILSPDSGDVGAGVMVSGTGTTLVNITGGTFTGNERYGIEVNNGSFVITSAPTCSNNDLGCINDHVPPTLHLPGNMTVEATGPSGAAVSYTATATDNIDASVAVSCSPASGSIFAISTTTVHCSATDMAGNTATGNFTVTVRDTTAPILSLPSDITAEATSPSGAVVSFSATAADLVSGAVSVTCTPASGSTFPLGVNTVNCSAADARGNQAGGSFTVTVQDTTPPVIAQPADIVSSIQNIFGGKKINYPLPITTDAYDGNGTATCTPPPGSSFKVGETIVTCKAVDSHGNVAAPVTFTVRILLEKPNEPSAFIPVTGGEAFNLDCNTQVSILDIKVIFYNLCDQQAVLNGVDSHNLPGDLPAGYSFVTGLNVDVLDQGQLLAPLPAGTGIEIDFPVNGTDGFAVLFWGNGQWVEVTQALNEGDINKALTEDSASELFKIVSAEKGMYKVLTAENTGTFILIKK